jgi:protein-S-isoprenylcysteine O-methyltransferase Ste14
MKEILAFLALCAVMAVVASWSLNRRWPRWSDQKLTLIAALPVPIIFIGLCLFVFVRAALAPKESCGVDTCSMAMNFALVGMFWGAMGYGIGLGAAALALRKLRP